MELLDDTRTETTGMGWHLEVTRERESGDVRGRMTGIYASVRAWIQASDDSPTRVQCLVRWESRKDEHSSLEAQCYGRTAQEAFDKAIRAGHSVSHPSPPLHEMQALAAMMEAQVVT